MLEKYEPGFLPDKFVREYVRVNRIDTKRAMAIFRKQIPLESYYQDKILKALRKRYPMAVIRKIHLGAYSQAGLPDVMMIYGGHYFGFEVKRPIVGEATALQKRTIELIRRAGGTAGVVCWPEECFQMVAAWERGESPPPMERVAGALAAFEDAGVIQGGDRIEQRKRGEEGIPEELPLSADGGEADQ